MTLRQAFVLLLLAAFLYYGYVELTYGGGDPNHKDHNPPRWW